MAAIDIPPSDAQAWDAITAASQVGLNAALSAAASMNGPETTKALLGPLLDAVIACGLPPAAQERVAALCHDALRCAYQAGEAYGQGEVLMTMAADMAPDEGEAKQRPPYHAQETDPGPGAM